jgi:VanZ family protein
MSAIFWSSSQTAVPASVATVSDKVLHASAYAGLAATIVWAWTRGAWASAGARHLVGAVGASALYGVSDEVHQMFVPPRTADPYDLLADVLGACAGAIAVWAWGIIARGSRNHHGV